LINYNVIHNLCGILEMRTVFLLQVGIRKRKSEASSDEVHVHQIKTALSLSGNVLKTQRKLRTKLREALQLSQIQETHPGELLRVNREILACSRQLSQHSCLLEQKLNAFGSACCTNFSELLQMNRRLKEKLNEQSQVLLHGPQLSAYQEMFTYLEELENTLKGHMMKFIQWLKATVAGVSAIPLNHNGWCKRQKVCRNEAKVEDPFGEQARGAWACTIEEKVENLQQELEKQGKKVEKLEETNEMLRNRVAELELLQKPPNIVQGQDDGDPQITRHVFHDCFYKINKWIDVKAMVPQLMKHRIISGEDDVHRVTQGSPAQNVINLYSKLSRSKNGFQIFYRCLRESQDEHLGHKDAADVLKQTAARTIEPGRSQLSPQSTRLL
jgi:DNA repair exonuclease SbcCD ATPase subunit